MHIYSFEKLDTWQLARQFAKTTYLITKKYPDDEKFGLVSQIRRASISVASNIAEGVSRKTPKEQARFIQIAYSSLIEVLNQLIISNDIGFITEAELINLREPIEVLSNKLNALYNSQIKKAPID